MPKSSNRKEQLSRALEIVRNMRKERAELEALAEEVGEDYLIKPPRNGSRPREEGLTKKFHIGDAILVLTYNPRRNGRPWDFVVEEGVESVG